MKQRVRFVVAIIAVQATFIGVYWFVVGHRDRQRAEDTALGTEPPRRVSLAMPELTVRDRDGSPVTFRAPDRPTIVHFWATWCPPCLEELPGLLALPKKYPLDVMAVALDENWTDVAGFLNATPMTHVFLGVSREALRKLRVRRLPVTFLVRPMGHIVLRFDGARDWTEATFLETWIDRIDERE